MHQLGTICGEEEQPVCRWRWERQRNTMILDYELGEGRKYSVDQGGQGRQFISRTLSKN